MRPLPTIQLSSQHGRKCAITIHLLRQSVRSGNSERSRAPALAKRSHILSYSVSCCEYQTLTPFRSSSPQALTPLAREQRIVYPYTPRLNFRSLAKPASAASIFSAAGSTLAAASIRPFERAFYPDRPIHGRTAHSDVVAAARRRRRTTPAPSRIGSPSSEAQTSRFCSGRVWRGSTKWRPSAVGRCTSTICRVANLSSIARGATRTRTSPRSPPGGRWAGGCPPDARRAWPPSSPLAHQVMHRRVAGAHAGQRLLGGHAPVQPTGWEF